MIEVTVKSEKLNRALRAVEGRIAKPRTAMSLAGRMGVAEVRKNFARCRDESGRVWQPLSPVTLALRKDASGKPLSDTGKLKASVMSRVQSATSALVYTKHIAAWAHQMGATNVPKRARILARELGAGKAKEIFKFARKEGLSGIRISQSKTTGKEYVVFGKRVKIPPRPFMFLYEGARQRIADTVADYLMKGASRA